MAAYTRRGYALDLRTNRPLIGVTVKAYNAETDVEVASTTTSSTGKWSFASLDTTVNYVFRPLVRHARAEYDANV